MVAQPLLLEENLKTSTSTAIYNNWLDKGYERWEEMVEQLLEVEFTEETDGDTASSFDNS